MKFFQLHHFSSSSPNFIFIGFSKFIGAPFLSILLLRHRSLTSRSLGRSNRTFTWRGREPEPPSPLSDKLRWRDSFDLFYIYFFDRPKFTWEVIQIAGTSYPLARNSIWCIQYGHKYKVVVKAYFSHFGLHIRIFWKRRPNTLSVGYFLL